MDVTEEQKGVSLIVRCMVIGSGGLFWEYWQKRLWKLGWPWNGSLMIGSLAGGPAQHYSMDGWCERHALMQDQNTRAKHMGTAWPNSGGVYKYYVKEKWNQLHPALAWTRTIDYFRKTEEHRLTYIMQRMWEQLVYVHPAQWRVMENVKVEFWRKQARYGRGENGGQNYTRQWLVKRLVGKSRVRSTNESIRGA